MPKLTVKLALVSIEKLCGKYFKGTMQNNKVVLTMTRHLTGISIIIMKKNQNRIGNLSSKFYNNIATF